MINIRFYMTTRLENPNYSRDLAIKVNIINFGLQVEGLSEQLLSIVVALDRPELQQAYADLNLQAAENGKTLKDLEDKILTVY